MPREDYLNIDLNKVVSGIGDTWSAKDDLAIFKVTTNSKISASNKGIKQSPETIAKRVNWGVTLQTRAKIKLRN